MAQQQQTGFVQHHTTLPVFLLPVSLFRDENTTQTVGLSLATSE